MRHDDDDLIHRIAAELKQAVTLDAGFDTRVMAEVYTSSSRPAWIRAWDWAREPRSFALSPLSGLALAAGIAGLVTIGVVASSPRDASPVAGRQAEDQAQVVQFVLRAPEARAVSLSGDFNGWDARQTPLVRGGAGLWSVALPLSPGRYTYTFVVDGTMFVADPAAPRATGDDFGAPSSVVTVGAARAAGRAL
ncbi:MAG: isoamylase early set domain-containing protein [Gemmatimonadota bacterium]